MPLSAILRLCKYCGAPLPPRHRVLCGSKDCARKENAEVQRRKTAMRKAATQRPSCRPVAVLDIARMSPAQIVNTFSDVKNGRAEWV